MVTFCNLLCFQEVKKGCIENEWVKTTDHHEALKSSSKHEFFTLYYIETCENIQSLETQLTINHF